MEQLERVFLVDDVVRGASDFRLASLLDDTGNTEESLPDLLRFVQGRFLLVDEHFSARRKNS